MYRSVGVDRRTTAVNELLSGFEPGTLVDSDLLKLATEGRLFVEEFRASNVKQACYELRASDVFWETWSDQENKLVRVGSELGYLLKPNRYVVAIVKEKIVLPANVVGRILAKGQLMSIGILPVNTYADPGFEGRLGITLFNGSRRYITIKPDQPIAKIEFTVLPRGVEKPYAGQHGYETEIWPIPVQFYADVDAFRKADLIKSSSAELEDRLGPEVANLSRRVDQYSRVVWVQIAVTVCCFLGLFALYKEISIVTSVITGIAANLITMLGVNLIVGRRAVRRG
jgi:dCTP deaminase